MKRKQITLTDVDGISFSVDIDVISVIRDRKSFTEVLFYTDTYPARVKESVTDILRMIEEAKHDDVI